MFFLPFFQKNIEAVNSPPFFYLKFFAPNRFSRPYSLERLVLWKRPFLLQPVHNSYFNKFIAEYENANSMSSFFF